MRVDGLRAYLFTLDRSELVDLLIDAAQRDPATERGLRRAVRRADRAIRRADDRAALHAAVERAFGSAGPLDYWPAIRYAQRAGEVAGALAALVRDGRAADACPLLERAIALLLVAVKSAEPSTTAPADTAASRELDGDGPLADLMRRLLASHADACAEARPDPVALAGWLLRLQFEHGWSVELVGYAPALAEAGLADYRDEVRRRWAADRADPRLRPAVEQLARLDRDVETLVEVVGSDLRHAAQYGRLARALHDIGATEAALGWAERGLRAFPDDPPGARLREFLVEAYLQRAGDPEAVAVRRDRLRATPHLRAYAALRSVAGHAGCWPAERAAALRVLRQRNPIDHVRALLHEERDPEAAWSAACRVAGLDGATWDSLARHRAIHHPAQAVPVLRRRVEEVLAGTGRAEAGRDSAGRAGTGRDSVGRDSTGRAGRGRAGPGREVYRDAARRLVELRAVSVRAGLAAEFDDYLETLLDRHRRRPSFLAELAEAGLTGSALTSQR